ncbi:MAG: exodeoxyribonuclease VII large subunit [Eggerthellaceae bacterium]|nr:exodeoxyribonuclease VII large subunit [Eggerthellaceae bacterium]
MTERSEQGAISVSQALGIAKGALEGITVRILGEVSELSNKPGYKAVYFTVKDDRSSLPCMMWMNRYSAAGVELRVGSLVEISGRFSLYAAKGRMNFDVFSISLAGEGNLRLKVANLARKLKAEGLMEPSRKKTVVPYPEKVGLVTSPRGAAVHDVLRTLRRRYPLAEVYLAGVPVEGSDAPKHIMAGIEALSTIDLDVILLVRGGGSFEDLMPFNDERLAYVIANSKVPIVTGIGHEPDTSIADMVADLRASTPTAAAESISPSSADLLQMLARFAQRMESSQRRRIADASARVDLLEARGSFMDARRLFADEAQSIDDLSMRLSRVLPDKLERMKEKTSFLRRSFERTLGEAVGLEARSLEALEARFTRAGTSMLDPFKTAVLATSSRLEDLSPLRVLARGYSITKIKDGDVVGAIEDVSSGSMIEVLVSDGTIDCEVLSTKRSEMTIDLFNVDV